MCAASPGDREGLHRVHRTCIPASRRGLRCTHQEWEQIDDGSLDLANLTDTEQERQTFDTNTAEDVIAVDHSNEPGLLETFAAFQTTLAGLQEAASRVMAAQHRMAEEAESSVATPAESSVGTTAESSVGTPAESSVGTPTDGSSVIAAGAIAAAKERCRTLVLETQELTKTLTKPET